jgi:hypothetical protein
VEKWGMRKRPEGRFCPVLNHKTVDKLNKKHIFIYSLVLRGFSLKTPTVLRFKFFGFLGF